MEQNFGGLERVPEQPFLTQAPQLVPKGAEAKLAKIQEEIAATRLDNFRITILERLAEMAASEISGQTLQQMSLEIERANRVIAATPGASEEQKARLNKELMNQLDWLGHYADLGRSAIGQQLYNQCDKRSFLEKWLWKHST